MNHDYYMQQALDLARLGWPQVAPNPMVGCVIVYKDEIVASGYHKIYGEAHAEVNAINALPEKLSPVDCILYVTLEPCSHHGKTPPCADLIIQSGFKTVIIASKDPNPLVAGSGIKKLEDAGIEVISGVLEEEARDLNKRFICFFEQKRPYVMLKWAQTADGFISRQPLPAERSENWISGKEAKVFVHQLRSEVMAIFVGKNTVINDNPLLTTRLVEGKNPLRLFIDRHLDVPNTSCIYNKEADTVVFNELKEGQEEQVSFVKLNFNSPRLPQIFDYLYKRQVQSVLVEGGAYLLNDLIEQNLWDEAFVIENPELYFEEGLKAPQLAKRNTFTLLGEDKLYHYLRLETIK